MAKQPFEAWWVELQELAFDQDWPLGDEQGASYREYYDDGYTPKEALDEERMFADPKYSGQSIH